MLKEDLFETAIKSLEITTGIQVKISKPKIINNHKDKEKLKIHAPQSATEYLLNLRIKRNLTNAALGNLAMEQKLQPEKIVLLADYVTPEQADKLRGFDIPFFDSAGNAYFNEPGLYVLVTGRKTKIEKEKPLRLFRPVSLRVLFLLLGYPEYLQKDYRTIAAHAGVSLGAVSETFNDLRKNRYLLHLKKNERRLTRTPELLKKWVEAYINKLRIDLRVSRFRTEKFQGRWWEDVNIKDFDAAWGGEFAAQKLTRHLKPAAVTIYSDSAIPRFQARFGLRRDPSGNVEIIKKFWRLSDECETVHPLIVYADLIESGDERNLETAQIIYEEQLTPLMEETAK